MTIRNYIHLHDTKSITTTDVELLMMHVLATRYNTSREENRNFLQIKDGIYRAYIGDFHRPDWTT